jgi:YbbR domain-containing protein
MGLKVAATAVGTLLWFTVTGRQIERRVPVSVSYSNVPDDFEMTGDQLDDATVRVRGGDTAVSELGSGNLHVIVDLTSAHAGANLIPLRTDQVVAPIDVEVLQVEPSSVTVTLEKAGQQQVEVSAVVDGTPAAGYAIASIAVEPRTVTVIGPVSRLRDRPSVVTERISIAGRTGTVTETVNVGVADSQLRLGETHSVRVTVRLEKQDSTGRTAQ